MSTSMHVMEANEYRRFIEELRYDMPFERLFDSFMSISYYTNFSGNLFRLYNVLEEIDQFEDGFTQEFSYAGFETSTSHLKSVIESSHSDALSDKWNQVVDRFADKDRLVILVDV